MTQEEIVANTATKIVLFATHIVNAAISDMTRLAHGESRCHVCKYDGSEHPHVCNVCETGNQWVWRGPQKEANL